MRTIHDIPEKREVRKILRKSATPQEIILWSKLRKNFLGHKFRRQHSIGKYVVDFYCPQRKLVIELDGWQHRERKEYDKERTRFIEDLGFKVLRFWNSEINKNIEGVILKIREYL